MGAAQQKTISQSGLGRYHLPTFNVSRRICRFTSFLHCFFPLLHYCKYFPLFGSEQGLFSKREPNGPPPLVEKLFITSVCRDWRGGGGGVGGGTSASDLALIAVCKMLRAVCLSLHQHQMGGVYGIR
ncbi:hypothetical protein XENOCAPTIV_024703 [Xenoophorus captivus]|uniref:Uncharacterized protein n=1 Tax=Xenoophorus captivus TaxID=1517983 RepID=A0ABV0QP35_9TELE